MRQPWGLGKARMRITMVRQVGEHLPTQQDTLPSSNLPTGRVETEHFLGQLSLPSA